MLEILKAMIRETLMMLLASSANNTVAQAHLNSSDNQNRPKVINNKPLYLRLGRLVMYYAGISGLNAIRIMSINYAANTFNMPILKYLNDLDNAVPMSVLQQGLFMGLCNRLDLSITGKMAMTSMQCILLCTAFYRSPKAALINCSLAMCLPIKCSRLADVPNNFKMAIKEIFNFQQGI